MQTLILILTLALFGHAQLYLGEERAFMLTNVSYHSGGVLSFSLQYSGKAAFTFEFTNDRKIVFTPMLTELQIKYTTPGNKHNSDLEWLYNGPMNDNEYWVGFKVKNIKPQIGGRFLPVLVDGRYSALIPMFRFPVHLVHIPLYPSSLFPVMAFQVNSWEHAFVLYIPQECEVEQVRLHWGDEPDKVDSVTLSKDGPVPVRWNHENQKYQYTQDSDWGKGWFMKIDKNTGLGKVVRPKSEDKNPDQITVTIKGSPEYKYNVDLRDFNTVAESILWKQFLREAENAFHGEQGQL